MRYRAALHPEFPETTNLILNCHLSKIPNGVERDELDLAVKTIIQKIQTMRLSSFVTAVATTIAICACNQPIITSSKTDFLAANIDSSTKPEDNFFQYANGGWLKNNPIPETEAGWGIGNLVQEDIYSRLRKINETALTFKAAAGTIDQKIGDFWFSGMDSADIEKQGLKPLQADLDKINAIASMNDLVAVAADFHNKGIGVLFHQIIFIFTW